MILRRSSGEMSQVDDELLHPGLFTGSNLSEHRPEGRVLSSRRC